MLVHAANPTKPLDPETTSLVLTKFRFCPSTILAIVHLPPLVTGVSFALLKSSFHGGFVVDVEVDVDVVTVLVVVVVDPNTSHIIQAS